MELIDQLVAAEDPARSQGERLEDVELADRQRDFGPAPMRGPGFGIEPQLAFGDHAAHLWLSLTRGGAAQDRVGAGDHFARGKRLGDVVIGAKLDPQHPVELVVAAGEEQHRQIAARAQAAAHLQPVHPRHVDIEHHQIGSLPRDRAQCLFSVARFLDREAGLVEGKGQQGSNMGVVIDQKNAAGHGDHCRGFAGQVNRHSAGKAPYRVGPG